jgi:hypothetical protein
MIYIRNNSNIRPYTGWQNMILFSKHSNIYCDSVVVISILQSEIAPHRSADKLVQPNDSE